MTQTQTAHPTRASSSTYALEIKDLRKNFGKTEIIRGINLAVNAERQINRDLGKLSTVFPPVCSKG